MPGSAGEICSGVSNPQGDNCIAVRIYCRSQAQDWFLYNADNGRSREDNLVHTGAFQTSGAEPLQPVVGQSSILTKTLAQ